VMAVQTLLEFKAMRLEVVDGHQMYEEESGRLSIDLLCPSALIFSTEFRRRIIAMALKRVLDTLVYGRYDGLRGSCRWDKSGRRQKGVENAW
jgi:hypothetical protein